MHASILNSVPAVHTTYITVLLYERYYRFFFTEHKPDKILVNGVMT